MNCCDARSTLPLLLDGQLAAGERAAAVEKAMACGLCRAELAALAQNDAALRRALEREAAQVPAGYFEDFAPRLLAKLDAETLEGESMRTSSGSGQGGSTAATPPPTGDMGKDVAGKPMTKDEFSGLHEIKALAANAVRRSTQSRAESEPGAGDALLATPAASLSNVVLPQPGKEVAPPPVRAVSVHDADGVPAAALSMPGQAAPKASRAGLYVGALGLLVAAGAVGLYVTGRKAPASTSAPAVVAAAEAPAAAPAPAPTPTPNVAPVAAAATAPAEAKPDEAKPAEPAAVAAVEPKADDAREKKVAKEPAAEVAKAEKTEKADKADKDKAEKKDAKAAPAVAAAPAPADAAKPAAKDAPKEAAHSEIDDIFGDKPAAAAKPAAPAGPVLPEKLGQDDVKKGMASVKARVQACYDEFKVSGTIKLKVKIEADGTVSSADVVDQKFAATDTGACVSAAVKTARFPAVSGTSLVVNYPFILQ